MSTPASPAPTAAHVPMFDRELTWLRFNERVLEEASDPGVPLLERVRFLSIFHSNLDEFFMIRVSGIKHQVEAGVDVLSRAGLTPRQQLHELSERTRVMLEQADASLNSIITDLGGIGVELLRYVDLNPDQQARWASIYVRRVLPTLTPLAISSAFPFPFVSNLSLNLGVYVSSADGDRRLVRIKIPDHLPRFVVADEGPDPSAPPLRLIPIEEIVAANLATLFPGMVVGDSFAFRVTRDADVDIREDEADDLLKHIENEVRKRRFGQAVRLEVEADMPADMLSELQTGLSLADLHTYRIRGLIAPGGLTRVCDLELPEHKFPAFAPRIQRSLEGARFFDRISSQDVLLHHPFDAFTPVAEFVRQAARDPEVLAIKQTLYRTSGDSPVVGALLEAVEAGKQVAAVIELKARFDEQNNITWAKRLEEAGVHVIYGMPGLKVHAKLCLVVRREDGVLRRYAHVGTGNYNPVTARIYTDLGLLTCDPDITADIADLFNRITGFAHPDGYRTILVAPRFLKAGLIARIERETEHARAGRPAHLIAKCNAVTEPDVIAALYDASQAGVQVDLLVRGICCVVPGRPGLSEHIRVRSVVGRFLEHSRVFWFANGGSPDVLIGSADIMGRNLNRRIEVLVPIKSRGLRTWLRETYLEAYLTDHGRTRMMQSDGSYERLRTTAGPTPDVHDGFLRDTAG